MRQLPACLKPFLEECEDRRKRAYLDSAGIPTIGIGHTGDDVRMGMVWTDAQIDAAYKRDALEHARLIPLPAQIVEQLGEHQYAALISFVFNAGPRPGATLWKVIKAGQLDRVPLELAKWNKATVKGRLVTLSGLVNRRAKEVQLWLKDDAGQPEEHVSTSSPAVEISPSPADATPPQRSATLLTAAAGAVAAAPPMVNQAMQAIQPYAEQSDTVKRMLGVLAAIGAILAIAGIVLIWVKKREARR